MARARMRASIEVEVAALEQLQALEVEELKLRQRKVSLFLRTKLAIANWHWMIVQTLKLEYNKYSILLKVCQHQLDVSPVSQLDNSEKVEPLSSTPKGVMESKHFFPKVCPRQTFVQFLKFKRSNWRLPLLQ